MWISLGVTLNNVVLRVAKFLRALITGDSTAVKADSTQVTVDQERIIPTDPLAVTGDFSEGTQGVAYSDSIPISGGSPPYTMELTGGTVPPGYTLSLVGNEIVLTGSDN